MADRIQTKHPQGKDGVHIDRAKYDTVKRAVMSLLRVQREMTLGDLLDATARKLGRQFSGSANWYVMAVKLDLEARGVIERVPDRQPQRLRFRKSSARRR